MKRLKGQSGQGTIEAVLLLVLISGIGLYVTHTLQERQFAQKLFGNPWSKLSGMIECGSWEGCAKENHPSSMKRILSYRPNE